MLGYAGRFFRRLKRQKAKGKKDIATKILGEKTSLVLLKYFLFIPREPQHCL